MQSNHRRLLLALLFAAGMASCVSRGLGSSSLHRWWTGLGPVLPHDTFPADCRICHVGNGWNTLVEDFAFDHETNTGVPLVGAHAEAKCLLCHNDRGPVAVFNARGCAGCHEDYHRGSLGSNCAECHREQTWQPYGMIERHARTRFPLTGAHAATACVQCHKGARVGNFVPVDTECLSCHQADLAVAFNPPHLNLGFVDRCDRCHTPTNWNNASIERK